MIFVYVLSSIALAAIMSCGPETVNPSDRAQSYEKAPYKWLGRGECIDKDVEKSGDCETCLTSCKKACEKFPRDSDNRAACNGQCFTSKDRCSSWFR